LEATIQSKSDFERSNRDLFLEPRFGHLNTHNDEKWRLSDYSSREQQGCDFGLWFLELLDKQSLPFYVD
jgi:hypothetical protein